MNLSNNNKIQKQNDPKTKLKKRYNFYNFKNIDEVKTKFLGEIVKHTHYNITLFIEDVVYFDARNKTGYALLYSIIEDPIGEMNSPPYVKNSKPAIVLFSHGARTYPQANAENYYIVNE
jgi:hypothetical protein